MTTETAATLPKGTAVRILDGKHQYPQAHRADRHDPCSRSALRRGRLRRSLPRRPLHRRARQVRRGHLIRDAASARRWCARLFGLAVQLDVAGYLECMGWDAFPRDADGRRRTAAEAFQEVLVPSAVAVYVSVKSGNAYAALPGEGDEVYPAYFRVEEMEIDGRRGLAFKRFSIEESPYRWPAAVANVLTHW